MSKGPGKVENLILHELRKGKPISVNQMAIAVLAARQGVKAEDTGIISLDTKHAAYQSTARAVRSLINKGIIATTST